MARSRLVGEHVLLMLTEREFQTLRLVWGEGLGAEGLLEGQEIQAAHRISRALGSALRLLRQREAGR